VKAFLQIHFFVFVTSLH